MMRGAFLGQVRLVRPALGQFSWNTYAQPFGAVNPVYGAPGGMPPGQISTVPGATLMPEALPGGRTYDCTNGSDIRLGVDAATAAALKKEGYVCQPSARASGGYGGGLPQIPGDTGGAGGMQLPGDYGMYGRIPTRPIGLW